MKLNKEEYCLYLEAINRILVQIDNDNNRVDLILSSKNSSFNDLMDIFLKYRIEYPTKLEVLYDMVGDGDIKNILQRNERLQEVSNKAEKILKCKYLEKFSNVIIALQRA